MKPPVMTLCWTKYLLLYRMVLIFMYFYNDIEVNYMYVLGYYYTYPVMIASMQFCLQMALLLAMVLVELKNKCKKS